MYIKVNIFRIQVNARKVKTSIGGYITINMNFFKAVSYIIYTLYAINIRLTYNNIFYAYKIGF